MEDEKKTEERKMRKIVVEESGEGLQKLMGQHVTLFCMNYIYAGDLITR